MHCHRNPRNPVITVIQMHCHRNPVTVIPVTVIPNDRLDVERIFEILSEMKPLRLIIMAPNGSALSVVLQNDGLDFCDVAKVAIQDLS